MYLQKREYGWYLRMPIPKGLRASYGKREICFSLRTKSKREAQLKSLEHIQRYLLEFERRMASTSSPKPSSSSSRAMPAERETSGKRLLHTELFSELYDKYLRERNVAQGTLLEFQTVVKRFLAICGDKDIRLYSKADIVHFKDVLLRYPRSLTKSDAALSPDELINKYASSDCQRIKPATVRDKYLAMIGIIFGYAVVNGFRADNPTSTVRVLVQPEIEPSRLPYSVEQIKALLSSPLLQSPAEDKFLEYRFIILLGIFTGARLEEICRLRREDIGEEKGIRYIFIRPNSLDGHTLKTASSRRRVPLHPRLFDEYGLQAYLELVKKEEYVFPIINQGNVVKGAISHAFSKWYGRFLRKTIPHGGGKLTFHSLRHSFKAFGRASNIEKTLLDALQGHKAHEVSLDYGRDEYGSVYSLQTLSSALERIEALHQI